jgi:hypothetical protein
MHYPDKRGITHRRYTLILSFPHSLELPDTPGGASTPFSCAVVCASGEIVWRAFGAYRSRWLFAQTPMNGKDPSCVTIRVLVGGPELLKDSVWPRWKAQLNIAFSCAVREHPGG